MWLINHTYKLLSYFLRKASNRFFNSSSSSFSCSFLVFLFVVFFSDCFFSITSFLISFGILSSFLIFSLFCLGFLTVIGCLASALSLSSLSKAKIGFYSSLSSISPEGSLKSEEMLEDDEDKEFSSLLYGTSYVFAISFK